MASDSTRDSRPTVSQTSAPVARATTNTNAKRLYKREKVTQVIITQTLIRPSSTRVPTATLHGTLPEVPVPHRSEGISDKQLGAILGATLGSVVVLVLLCIFLSCRRPSKYPKPRRYTPSPVLPPSREFPTFPATAYKSDRYSGTSRPPSYTPLSRIPSSSLPQHPSTRQGSGGTRNNTTKAPPDLSSESESEVPMPPPAPPLPRTTLRSYRFSITTPLSELRSPRRSQGSREHRRSSGN